MKMDEHARAWAHDFVAGILNRAGMPHDRRSGTHWEILSHLHEAAERRAAAEARNEVTLADLHAVVNDLGGADGIARAFLDTRVAAMPRAGFGKRVGAFLIDAVVVLVGLGVATGIMAPLWIFGPPWGPFADPWRFFGSLTMAALAFGYFAVMEMRWGATLGKMALKLRTVNEDGSPLTPQAAMVRNIAKVIPPLLVVDVVFYLVAFQKDDQRASDRLAETIVVDTNPQAVPPAPVSPAPSPPSAPGAAPPPPPPARDDPSPPNDEKRSETRSWKLVDA